jgi:hypothetical protein
MLTLLGQHFVDLPGSGRGVRSVAKKSKKGKKKGKKGK